jgi:hypothetical protein
MRRNGVGGCDEGAVGLKGVGRCSNEHEGRKCRKGE